MPYPRLSDDGRTVELDLHGATVREAGDIIRRLVQVAARRGRATVRVIHGASTSEVAAERHTIRTLLHEMLETGALAPDVTTWFAFDTATTLSLPTVGRVDESRIALRDVVQGHGGNKQL